MKKISLAFLFILISIVSCQQKNTKGSTQQQNKPLQNLLPVKPASEVNKPALTDTIINNDFVSRVLDGDISLSKVLSAYHPINQTVSTSVNKYDSKLTDTLKTITSRADTFSFLIATGKETLISCNIQTNKMSLDTTIAIGVSKAVFASKFGVSNIPDLLIVKDLEGGTEFKFVFNPAGTLIKMSYQIQYLE